MYVVRSPATAADTGLAARPKLPTVPFSTTIVRVTVLVNDPLVPVIVAAGDAPEQNPLIPMFMLFAPILVLYFFIVLKPQRKEQKARQSMLSALKKNDRVLTIGGIIGTVSNISADGEEVTLRVDDNAKIRFTRSSIQKVLNVGDQPADVGGSDKT